MVEDLRDLLGLGEGSAVTLVNLVPPGLSLDVDPEQLSRILLNLGRNAVQVLTEGEAPAPEKMITVTARRVGRTIQIEVSDTGPGVPPRAREKLFEAFQSSTRPGGTDLASPSPRSSSPPTAAGSSSSTRPPERPSGSRCPPPRTVEPASAHLRPHPSRLKGCPCSAPRLKHDGQRWSPQR